MMKEKLEISREKSFKLLKERGHAISEDRHRFAYDLQVLVKNASKNIEQNDDIEILESYLIELGELIFNLALCSDEPKNREFDKAFLDGVLNIDNVGWDLSFLDLANEKGVVLLGQFEA